MGQDVVWVCAERYQSPPKLDTVVTHIDSLPCSTLEDQMVIVSSIPNYHWCAFTSKGGKGPKHVTYAQHLLHNPGVQGVQGNSDGILKCCYPSTSPRNKLMFFIMNWADDEKDMKLNTILSFLLDYDTKQPNLEFLLTGSPTDLPEDAEPSCPLPPKKRKTKAQLASTNSLCQNLGVTLPPVVNRADQDRTMYQRFCEETATEGTIIWRKHTIEYDVIIMNDYSPTTGDFLPSAFVHLTALAEDELVKCTCSIYEQLCSSVPSVEVETSDVYLSSQVTCIADSTLSS